jgi:mRNA interferase MazF
MAMVVERFGVYLVPLDPTVGAEMRKARPCTIISPNELNERLRTVIVAPLTRAERPLPFRVNSTFAGKRGQVALDQMRAVDKARLVKRLGRLDVTTASRVIKVLLELFA